MYMQTNACNGTVAELVGHSICVREVVGSIPCRVIRATLKMVLAALPLCSWH